MRPSLYALLWLAVSTALPAQMDPSAGVAFDQRLNTLLPLQVMLRDEEGQSVSIGDYLGATPAVLLFAYYSCSSQCPTVIATVIQRLDAAGMDAIRQPPVIVLSIDPLDRPAQAKLTRADYQRTLGAGASRLHLLTGERESIRQITQAAGFQAVYDAPSRQFRHAAGIVLLTPQGRIAQYFFGYDYSSTQLTDALHQAAQQQVATPVQRLLMLCFNYDPVSGRYSADILSTLRTLGVIMLLGLAIYIGRRLWRRNGRPFSTRAGT